MKMTKDKLVIPMFATLEGTLLLENDDALEITDSWYWYVNYPPTFYMGPFASKELAQKDWDRIKRVEHDFREHGEDVRLEQFSKCVYYKNGVFCKGDVKISYYRSIKMHIQCICAYLK